MIKMTEESRAFLLKNLPEVLDAKHVNDILDPLYTWIDIHGFQGEEYNARGDEAQAVYDDIYLSNP